MIYKKQLIYFPFPYFPFYLSFSPFFFSPYLFLFPFSFLIFPSVMWAELPLHEQTIVVDHCTILNDPIQNPG
jgi:hypothetical protein